MKKGKTNIHWSYEFLKTSGQYGNYPNVFGPKTSIM